MQAFTARSSTPVIDLGTRLTLTPAHHPGGPPRPEIPAGLVIDTQADLSVVPLRVTASTTIDGLTRAFVIERPDGRLYRVSPQTPSEGGGYWEPGKGQTVWVVRWQVEG